MSQIEILEPSLKDGVAERWTKLELECLRKISNRDFQKWLKDRQDKSQQTNQS